jgi:hypothetical protein
MAATKNDIRNWLDNRPENATHILSVCDTFSYEDYPVYVLKGESVKKKEDEYNNKNMQKVNEIYSFNFDKYEIEKQLSEYRSFHYD